MEATTIDQLFSEVLEEIFSHLSASDVKNCALVCKKWDEVIGSAEMTMKKFELKFDDGEWKEESGLLSESQKHCSTRKHRNVSIRFHNLRPTKSPILENFDSSQVKELNVSIEFNETVKTIMLPNMLSRMPLLEDLHISLYKANFNDAGLPIVTLAKLRKLYVSEDSTVGSIFKFIKTPNITDLIYYEGLPGNEHSAAFIKDKKHLANLTTTNNLFTQLFGRHDLSKLRLESLDVIRDLAEYFDTAQESLKKLLLSNANSLTSLRVPAQLISKEVFMAIFCGLRKLAMLYIEGDVNVNGSWMENLSPNRTLKSLILTQRVINDGLVKILQLAPHIETLSLYLATNSLLHQVAAFNRRLVELEICHEMESYSGRIRFNELKSLKLNNFKNVDILSSMLVSCSKIETFAFQECNEVEVNNIVDILLQQNTLKHLEMHGLVDDNPMLRSKMFDKLKVNFGNLRSITFISLLGEIIIQFDFPENPAEWNMEEQEARFASYLAYLYAESAK